MAMIQTKLPRFTQENARKIAREFYGIHASVRHLESYIDQNFLLTDERGDRFVLKVANMMAKKEILDAQNQAMEFLADKNKTFKFPRVLPSTSGEKIIVAKSPEGDSHCVRMLSYLPGTFLSAIHSPTADLLHSLGYFLASMDKTLLGFFHPGTHRELHWNLKNAMAIMPYTSAISDPSRRRLVEYFLLQFETNVLPALPKLRQSVIHNDANDHNILVETIQSSRQRTIGIIDFGDMVYTWTICELAIALAYVMLDREEPIAAAIPVIRGYHEVLPLKDLELRVLFDLIGARLCISVTTSAYYGTIEPENAYSAISEKQAWTLLENLIEINPHRALQRFREACELPQKDSGKEMSREEILRVREQHIGRSLSVAYQKPLKIVKGAMQYLYDDSGRTYLDAVNNVCHVGHCHPRVVRAARKQMAILNTNTRYLYDQLVEYAQRLSATLPERLSVCYFVCSGSEANDLALRLARVHTRQKEVIVVDRAYHGTTTSVIELSPYKFDGPGGEGIAPYVHKVVAPDVYRGLYKREDPDAGKKYARHVWQTIDGLKKEQKGIAAFICESAMGCGGQIILPDNYLKEAFQFVREAGGVCIADEVQVGFGRVGTHFWGFETQGVVPDIVTLGKPIGNGHPLAAVVTTPEIAETFHNGMEYFNTFGGNPVSCAVGLAVLDVIEEEKLQENALKVGNRMKAGLERLKSIHSCIGDVRGLGLFMGVELVLDRETRAPATHLASEVVEKMKDHGILISTDGPFHNVLKIKPPLVFTEANADYLVNTLAKVLDEIKGTF